MEDSIIEGVINLLRLKKMKQMKTQLKYKKLFKLKKR